MSVKYITSRENPSFRSLLALAERRQTRQAERQTLLDGEHLLGEAVAAGILPSRLIAGESALDALQSWQDRLPGVPALQLPDALLRRLSPVATPSGLMAVIDIPAAVDAQAAEFIVLLEDIQDPGNLGALLRTAAAAGVEAVYLSPGCAEAWSPKTLRGGQGGHFRLNIIEGAKLDQVAAGFTGAVCAAALGSGMSLFGLDLSGPAAFVFGNEGAGLSDALKRVAEPFTIPMPGGAESLNVAAAAAVCLFERVRQVAAEPAIREAARVV